MQAELTRYFTLVGLMMAGGAAILLLKIVLGIVLRNRLAPGLVPHVNELSQPDSTSRFIALIGRNARPDETLGTLRLRATLGLKAVYWLVCLAIAVSLNIMQAPVIGIESLLFALVLAMALHVSFYEISYDRQTVTLPRWWFGRSTRKWKDLLAVSVRDGWFMVFHFDDGQSIYVHKYVVGYPQLLETARKAAREN